MQVGSQRILAEVLRPQPRRELGYAVGWVLSDALQYVDQIGIGIDAVKPAGTDQALHDTNVFGTKFSPAEQPVFSVMRSSA